MIAPRAAGVLAAALLLLGSGCTTRTPDLWEIPEGYVGWAIVQYESSNCASLATRDGFRVLHLSARARLCTSDRLEAGEAFDKYRYVSADGRVQDLDQRTMVWGAVITSKHRYFAFIGPESAFRSSDTGPTKLDELCVRDPNC